MGKNSVRGEGNAIKVNKADSVLPGNVGSVGGTGSASSCFIRNRSPCLFDAVLFLSSPPTPYHAYLPRTARKPPYISSILIAYSILILFADLINKYYARHNSRNRRG